MGSVNGWELVLLLVIGIVVLGPERLPEYAAKLGRLVRQLRDVANGARSQLRDEMGPAFDDVDWDQLDPRRYDPRRIVREALAEPAPGPTGSHDPTATGYDATAPTPFDAEAT